MTARTLATTEQIEIARAAGAIAPPTSWDLTILPAGGKIVAKWFDAKGRVQCAYSASAVEARNAKKFADLLRFTESLPNIRRAVVSDLDSADSRTRACAAIVAIMDATTMRVGGAEYADANAVSGAPTYGASSLLKSHVNVDGETISFDFTGKHHKSHSKTITDALLAPVIADFAASTEVESLFPVTETAVRGYLSQFGATPKMYRTYHASWVASATLESLGVTSDVKQCAKNIAQACKVVSEMLGNTPNMARKSYINPAILADYAQRCGC